jgi:hypothetical protein
MSAGDRDVQGLAAEWGVDDARLQHVVDARRSSGLGCRVVEFDDKTLECRACGRLWSSPDLIDEDWP